MHNPEKILNSDYLLPAMVRLALPMMISGFISAFYNVVDSLFVGRYVGDLALAALAVNNTIQVSLTAIGGLFSVGVSSIISRSLGAGNPGKAGIVLSTGLSSSLILTMICAWALLFNLDRVLLWIGSPPEVLKFSRQYGGVLLWFAFITPVNDVLNSALRASGLAQWVMALMLTGGLSNILLDALFIIIFGWGVIGAAVATVLAQVIVFIAALILVNRRYPVGFNPLHILRNLDFSILWETITVGFPSLVKSSIFVLMNLSANRALAGFGAEAIAGFGVIYKIVHLAYQPIFGFNLGVQPFVGYNYGAMRFQKVKDIIHTANGAAVVLGLFPMIFFIIAPEPIFALFTHSPQVIAHARNSSFMIGITFFLYGFQVTSTGAALAMGRSFTGLIMAALRPALLLAFMVSLPPLIGVYGVWTAFPATDILASLIIFWMLGKELKRPQFSEGKVHG